MEKKTNVKDDSFRFTAKYNKDVKTNGPCVFGEHCGMCGRMYEAFFAHTSKELCQTCKTTAMVHSGCKYLTMGPDRQFSQDNTYDAGNFLCPLLGLFFFYFSLDTAYSRSSICSFALSRTFFCQLFNSLAHAEATIRSRFTSTICGAAEHLSPPCGELKKIENPSSEPNSNNAVVIEGKGTIGHPYYPYYLYYG